MSLDAIKEALSTLHADPEHEGSWSALENAVTEPGVTEADALRLLGMARAEFESRRDWSAVARLLELELAFAGGGPVEVPMLRELAQVYGDELVDSAKMLAAYQRLLAVSPDDEAAAEIVAREGQKREKYREVAARYLEEAEQSGDDGFKAALLASAADVLMRFGGDADLQEAQGHVARALQLDPRSRRAGGLAELLAKKSGDARLLAAVQKTLLDGATSKDERLAAALRLGRTYRKLEEHARAADAYAVALEVAPHDATAQRLLAESYQAAEDWDRLAALYEEQLRGGKLKHDDELGLLIQVGLLHWKRRHAPEQAEPFFERARKLEAGQQAALSFFREVLTQRGDSPRLVAVLTDAQRAATDTATKTLFAAEIARLAEGQENAQKAIEQYKAVLRGDPANKDARDALKRLYRETEGYVALVELYRQDLERAAPDDAEGRLAVLREMAVLYRDKTKNDATLLQVLSQMAQLDDRDIETVRELCKVCESLQRWRDLLAHQQRLAELTPSKAEKVDLFRSVARRWAEQFNNAQNAIGAYEALLEVEPTDDEAQTKLKDLYLKRRAWPQLFALYEKQAAHTEGAARLELLSEMAKLAAERLDRGADAIALMKEILAEDASAPGVLDGLEKQAEREKDFVTVAEVLERRVDLAGDDAGRVAALQKLGAVYADRLKDPVLAAKTWRRILDLQPGHTRALRVLREAYVASGDWDGLEELYASQNDWEGLVDFLSSAADRSTDGEQKVDVSLRAARIYEEKLEAPARAARSYERVLSVLPSDVRAARALLPLYEEEEKWARLPALYEILLGATEDVGERVKMLRRLAAVTGGPLADKNAALLHAQRAYDLAPDDDGLSLLESWSRTAGSWAAYVEALEGRLKDKSIDADARRSFRLRLADVYARELERIDEAVLVYRDLLDADPTDFECVQALDSILRASGRRDDLRWLFELRSKQVEGGDRADVLEEWAAIEEEVFGDSPKAVALLRQISELDPERRGTLRQLARLLVAAGSFEEAAAVVAKHRDLTEGADRAALELELAGLYLERLERPEDALEACVRALEAREHDTDAIGLLSSLLDKPAARHRAAAVLAREYEALGDARREAQALSVMLEGEQGAAPRRDLHKKLADVFERKLSSPGSAFDVVLRALNEGPSELELWDRAAGLAERAGRPTDLSEAYRMHLHHRKAEDEPLAREVELELSERAARLHEDQLGDGDGAMPYLRRVLALEPSRKGAFVQLKNLLTASERWGELEELYDRAVEATSDAAERVELLGEVALVAEDIMGDVAKAITYHERLLGIDPSHIQSLDALEKLYARAERHGALAELVERRIESGLAHDEHASHLGLGKLYLDRIQHPGKALDHLEIVLRESPHDADARALVERILEEPSLRLRAARVLQAVYETKDDVRNLVRVLELRSAGAEEAAEKKDLLRRIASLRDERLRDDAGAFAALAELVPLDPEDGDARASLLEIGRRLGSHEAVAEVLTKAADAADGLAVKGEILMSVASIFEDLVDDVARAEKVYRRVAALDPADGGLVIPAAKAIARICEADERYADLADVLALEVKLESDPDRRRELYMKLGTLAEDRLADLPRATAAWEARLADDSGDLDALEALERLYERTEQWEPLVKTLRAREEIEPDEHRKKAALVKIAVTLDTRLRREPDAIEAWQRVQADFGPERETHAALAKLYEATQRWSELSEVLEADLAIAEEQPERLELLCRMGDVRRKHQDDLAGALDAYRQALMLEPADARARGALEEMLELAGARREAAETLHPLYEADGDSEKLLRVLTIEADSTDDLGARLELLRKALRTAEGPVGDPARALELAKRGVRDAAAEPSIASFVDDAERLAEKAEKKPELFALYQEVVADVLDGDVAQSLRLRLGELARGELGQRDTAITKYREALEAKTDDRRAMQALEELYTEAGDFQSLHDVLRQRAEVTDDDAEKEKLLFRIAELQRERLADTASAIATYEAILDLELDAKAIAALEALYETAERFPDLVALYERQLEAGVGSAADLRVRIAVVSRRRLGDVPRAFDELGEALSATHHHPAAIAELEDLLANASEPDDRARAGEMLEHVYLAKGQWQEVRGALEARLAAASDPGERRELLQRLASLHEEQLEDYGAALDTVGRLFHEDIRDESVWSDLERLAKVAGAEKRLAEVFARELAEVDSDDDATAKLARRTGEIAAGLGDTQGALLWYRRAHAFEPESEELFAAIDALLVREKKHAERVELYRAGLDYRDDAGRIEALHVIAGLERRELAEPEKAVDAYRAVLDLDEGEARALDALTELYAQLSRHHDLADLYLRRAESAPDAEQAAPYRLDLADLFEAKLGDKGKALDQLEAIVADVPWSQDAIKRLERFTNDEEHKARAIEVLRPLYERADDWKLLVKLNEERLGLATDPADRVEVLRETARLWETRGDDRREALKAIRAAFATDPEDGDTRAELERLAESEGAHRDLALSFEAAIAADVSEHTKRELLGAVARVYDLKLDDPRAALGAYERLWALDPSDLDTLQAMDDLAVLLSDWSKLIDVLEKKAEAGSDSENAEVLRRIARIRHEMLDDEPGAAKAFERSLELEADSVSAIDALLDLYEPRLDFGGEEDVGHTKQSLAERLAELYQRRVELADADETDLRFDLQVRAGRCQETHLKSPRDAITAYLAALDVRPGERDVLKALEKLFRAESMWDELLENLTQQASSAEGRDERVALRLALGDLQERELGSSADALEQYRLVIAEDPKNAAAIDALRGLGDKHEELRLDVADVLEPVLREAERFADAVAVLELRLRAQSEPGDRARTLRAVAELEEQRLARPTAALGALLRALDEAPDDTSLHADIERLAALVPDTGFVDYASALEKRVEATYDAELGKDLAVRLGKVSEEKLADPRRAVRAYVAAVEKAGDDDTLLASLDRLYEKLGDSRELADVLERRVPLASSDAAAAELYHRLAKIQIDTAGDPQQGITTLRLALERVSDHEASTATLETLAERRELFDEASEILEGVYRAKNDHRALARVFERRIALAPAGAERVRMRLDLARILEGPANDAKAAQAALEIALGDDVSDLDVLAELERLAPITDGWASASKALDAAIQGAEGLSPDTARDLWTRLATWYRERTGDKAAAERALERALERDPTSEEILRGIEALQREPGRERDLVGTLRRLAALDALMGSSGELRREAKSIAEGPLGDAALAEAILRDMVKADDGDTWALAELTKLRERAGDAREVFDLIQRQIELAVEADKRSELRHEAARVAREKLGDDKQSIELYEALFDDDPSDARASTALRELFEKTGRHKDLSSLLGRLTDLAETVERRIELRLESAALFLDKLDARDDAAEQLRAVLDEDRTNERATVLLAQIFEKTGRDAELAELYGTQVEEARARGDGALELSFSVRLGEVYESRLGDVAKAVETFHAVLERDPKHAQALLAVARLEEKRGDKAAAAAALARLLDVSQGAEAIKVALRLADLHAALRDAEQTRAVLERALGLDRRDLEVRRRLLALYESSSAWRELADLVAENAELASEPTEKVALYKKAAELHRQKRNDPGSAADLLEKASALVPQDRELLLALCDAFSDSGRGKRSIEALQKIVDSFGGRRSKELAGIHFRLARAQAAEGDVDKAIEELDTAFKIDPGSIPVLRERGVLSLELADKTTDEKQKEAHVDRALKTFQALMMQKLDDKSPITKAEVFYYMAEVSRRQGNDKKAIQMLERALDNDKNLGVAKELMAKLKP
jgi:tetratricopeptide (TPR) repeat protein